MTNRSLGCRGAYEADTPSPYSVCYLSLTTMFYFFIAFWYVVRPFVFYFYMCCRKKKIAHEYNERAILYNLPECEREHDEFIKCRKLGKKKNKKFEHKELH